MNPSQDNPQNGTNEPPVNNNVSPRQPDIIRPQPESTQSPGLVYPANMAPANTLQSAPIGNTQPVNGSVSPPYPSQNSRPKPKKKLILSVIAGLAVLILGAGAVFGWYLPNKPENVWNTGLNRSGKGIDSLVTKLTNEQELKKFQNSEITASVDVKSKEYNVQGTLDTKVSKNKVDGHLDVNVKAADTPEKKLALAFMSELPEGKDFPNSYFKISGLKELGLGALIGETSAYENKWIAVSSEYLASVSGQAKEKTPKRENVSSQEVADLIRTVSNTNNEYLLTDNKDKAVLERREFKGKEIVDGMRAYRYKVGINKPHAKEYCKVVSQRVLEHPTYKKLSSQDDNAIAEQKKSSAENCDKDLEKSLQDDPTFDMWIDAKYKLIHKIRITDKKDAGTYTDIGQIYKGGDQLNFFVAYHSDKQKSDAKFTLKTDTKTSVSSGEFTWKQSDESGLDAKVGFEAKPYSGEVKVEKPAGAINIEELLKMLGVNPAPRGGNPPVSGSGAKDAERKLDISLLEAQLNEYAANHNGRFPTLANLNDAAWRAKNMPDLRTDTMQDPDGTTPTLATASTAKSYGYAPTQCTTAGCRDYTLSATLSDGKRYAPSSEDGITDAAPTI